MHNQNETRQRRAEKAAISAAAKCGSKDMAVLIDADLWMQAATASGEQDAKHWIEEAMRRRLREDATLLSRTGQALDRHRNEA